jgi:4-azaleucine resistance transporter AzlC
MDFVAVRRGVRDVAPLLLGIAPFGLVAGVAAMNAGLTLEQAVGMSVIVFAGAAQLAALELIGQDAPLSVIVVTAVVINLRMMMYSASIAPYFRSLSTRIRTGAAYLLTDQAYALSVSRYRSDERIDRLGYYLGAAVAPWIVWQLTTVVGALIQTGVPASLGLEFAVPLVFLALLVPAMEDGPTTVAGVFGGVLAVLGSGLPLNLGLLVGAAVGIAAGVAAETALPVEASDGH